MESISTESAIDKPFTVAINHSAEILEFTRSHAQSDRRPILTLEHLDLLLETSGLSESICNEAGVFSAALNESLDLVGFEAPGIAFPYHDLSSKLIGHRIRLDSPTGDAKYLQKKGTSLTCYFLKASIPHILDVSKKLFVCEGEKKLLAMGQVFDPKAHALTSYPGCWNWAAPKDDPDCLTAPPPDLSETWKSIPMQGRRVALVCDTDFFFNVRVKAAGCRFIELLKRRGATVELIDLRIPEEKSE